MPEVTTPTRRATAEMEAVMMWQLLAGLACLLLTAALVWFTMFPRFEVIAINDGHSILIHDRWRNRIQRADYDADGNPTLKRMLTPF